MLPFLNHQEQLDLCKEIDYKYNEVISLRDGADDEYKDQLLNDLADLAIELADRIQDVEREKTYYIT